MRDRESKYKTWLTIRKEIKPIEIKSKHVEKIDAFGRKYFEKISKPRRKPLLDEIENLE